ncbi:hypothetical protein GCM10027446_10820 [Angustibacter peucedani]
MGISAAFLNELGEQREAAVRELHAAQAVGDDIAAADAQARVEDLDELLSRNGGGDVRIDLDVVDPLVRAC